MAVAIAPSPLEDFEIVNTIGKTTAGRVTGAMNKKDNVLQNLHEFNQPFKSNKDSIVTSSFQHLSLQKF